VTLSLDHETAPPIVRGTMIGGKLAEPSRVRKDVLNRRDCGNDEIKEEVPLSLMFPSRSSEVVRPWLIPHSQPFAESESAHEVVFNLVRLDRSEPVRFNAEMTSVSPRSACPARPGISQAPPWLRWVVHGR
jgi:hypothetical protein